MASASHDHPNPVVIVTGASQGVGREISKLFASKGFSVVMTSRTVDTLERAAEEVRASRVRGGRELEVLALPADVGDREQVRGVVERAVERFGRIDVVVNNAGICMTGPATESTEEDWRRVMDTNLYGAVWTTELALPHLFAAAQTGGRPAVLTLGSFGGKMPLAHMSVYCASKYAVRGYVDTLRLELASAGVHVGLVHPGVIKSDFLQRAVFRGAAGAAGKAAIEQMLGPDAAGSPLVQTPAEVATAVWDCFERRKDEVVVGGAKFATEAYRLAPGLVGGLLARLASR